VLRQRPLAARVPLTGPAAVATTTFRSLPCFAATMMAAPGRTPRAPLAGLIVSVAAGVALAAVQLAAPRAVTDSPIANANSLRRPADLDSHFRTIDAPPSPDGFPPRVVPRLGHRHAAHDTAFTRTAPSREDEPSRAHSLLGPSASSLGPRRRWRLARPAATQVSAFAPTCLPCVRARPGGDLCP
jgi:cell pole-organizing protein PopZ